MSDAYLVLNFHVVIVYLKIIFLTDLGFPFKMHLNGHER